MLYDSLPKVYKISLASFVFYCCLWANFPIRKYIKAYGETALLIQFHSEVGAFLEKKSSS